MIEIEANFSGGLNLDDSIYNVPMNAYIDALNVTRDAVEGSNDKAITNIVGNRLVSYSLPSGRNKCIGAFPNTLRNTVIYMVWNENDFDLVLEYDDTTRTISSIFENLTDSDNVDILEFDENKKITSINVYPRDEGDLLYFLDSLGRPTYMDIALFKAGAYTPVTRDIIDVCKRPPLSPPQCVYSNDTDRRSNSLRNKLFRFKYRFIYDNNEKSTCSPISTIPLPASILNDTYNNIITNNNVISLTLYSGDKDVKKIELLMSYVNKTNSWSDFALVEAINKVDIGLRAVANSYDIGPLIPSASFGTIVFSGAVNNGTVINVYLKVLSTGLDTLIGTYTTVPGDTLLSVAINLAATLTLVAPITPSSNGIVFLFNNSIYEFGNGDVEVIPVSANNDNTLFPYQFYNDSTYPLISIDESIQLFDYVPDLANAQEMPNGNVLMYGGITEGYDKDLIPDVVNTVLTIPSDTGVPTGTLNATVNPGLGITRMTFSGIAAIGTVVSVQISRLPDNVVLTIGTYTTVAGDTPISISTNLVANMQTNVPPLLSANVTISNGVAEISFAYTIVLSSFFYVYNSTTIVAPVNSSINASVPTFLFSTERRIAIAYFDSKGKTNGILYDAKLTFPAYAENGSQEVLLPYINTKIFHTPPIWAYSYNFYLTKEPTQFIFWETVDVNTTEAGYIYFNVSNFEINQKKYPTTINVLSYNFQDGDRLRLIRNDTSNVVFNDTYDVAIEGQITDPKIDGVDAVGTYIKIKSFAPFSSVDYSSKYFVIQIYRPEQQAPNNENAVFYEFGQQYAILNPTLPTRVHAGMVSDQDLLTNTPAEFNFYEGDVYFRSRAIAMSETGIGAISETGIGVFNVLDRNFVDNYISAVNSIDGRPNVIDVNAKRSYYSALVRFGGAFQPNTNINNFNRFFPNDFEQYDYAFGDIMRFKVRDRYVRVFQKFKVGQVPLYHQILTDNNRQNLVVTDRLLNPIQYYVGDIGIGNNSESLASYNFADYFTTNVKGIIGRVSNDGVQFLSILYKVNSWATQQLPKRTGDYKVYGAFDQRLGNYTIALEATDTEPAYTIVYDEENNSFEGFLSFYPEMMTTLGVLFIAFKDGNLYTHDSTTYNNFFGVQYSSYIETVFNKMPLDKKTFLSLTEVASEVWEVPEAKTDLNSYGTVKMETNLVDDDFAELEGSFEASFLRDKNSNGGLINGDTMKGKYMTIIFRKELPTTLVSLNIVSLKYINSPLNNR